MVRAALAGPAADEPGYPTTHGTPALREALAGALSRRFGVVVDPAAVLPTIGSKELVALAAHAARARAGDTVVIPELAYPTYEVGVRLAGAQFVRADATTALGPARPALIWLNSPSNPTGQVLPPAHLRKVVEWARARGHGRRGRRVLPLAGGRHRAGLDPAPGRLRRLARGAARGALAVEVVEPRGVPGRASSRATPRWWRRCWRSASTRA